MNLDLDDQWKKIEVADLKGLIMVLGGMDTGKSTLCRYLYSRLCEHGKLTGFIDGDPGQSRLGPPTTMTLGISEQSEGVFPPAGTTRRMFVQSTTPAAHMLQVVSSAARLVWKGFSLKADAIVYDSTGLIDPEKGGLNLKLAKITLLRPSTVIGIQHDRELNPLLVPLRKSNRCQVITLFPCPSVQSRDMDRRRKNRENNFKDYFCDTRPLEIKWSQWAVFPSSEFQPNRLVGFENQDGFCLGLGIILKKGANHGTLTVTTPINDFSNVNAIRIGDITIDPETFKHERTR